MTLMKLEQSDVGIPFIGIRIVALSNTLNVYIGRQPDLWAGGMAGVAIADWEMNYEDSSDLLRSYQRMLFNGGPDERARRCAPGRR